MIEVTKAFGQELWAQKVQKRQKSNSRKSVRWSAVPVAPKLVYGRCRSEGGSGPEGADDLCLVRFEALGLNLSLKVVI